LERPRRLRPEFEEAARRFLAARKHKTIATLRHDGSPRISGIEAELRDGELWFGVMWRSVKALDLRRDPRFALHSGSVDPPEWQGDAKLSGRAVEVEDETLKSSVHERMVGEPPPGPYHLFRADIEEVAVVRLGEPADHLVIERWRAGEVTRMERR
jgi:hypothetical protein